MRRAAFISALIGLSAMLRAADWPQFRGPNARGVSEETNLPVEFGPEKNVVWKTPLPRGHSSPSIAGDRIFLTGFEGDAILLFAIDRGSGKILWRREAPRPRKQELHEKNSAVSPTPVTDGRNVYAFFVDFGLLAYGPDGNELWRYPLGPFDNPYGAGASPVLEGDTLLQICDQDTGSFLVAIDKNSGKTRWRVERPHAQRAYATPVIYRPSSGGAQVLITGSYQLNAYDVATGKLVWWIRGLPWQIKPTPAISEDAVYFVTYSGESDPGQQEVIGPFAEALKKLDANGDGRIAKDELTDTRAQNRFEYLDLDATGHLEARDWEQFRYRRAGESALRAYRLGGAGDVTETNLLWKNSRSLPNVPSPLFYRGVVYTMREGGIFTSYDAKSGAILKQGRLAGAPGLYFSSPVGADGRIYVASEEGKTTVIRAGAQWEVLAVNDMGDGVTATPAFVDGMIYFRTFSALYCFRLPK